MRTRRDPGAQRLGSIGLTCEPHLNPTALPFPVGVNFSSTGARVTGGRGESPACGRAHNPSSRCPRAPGRGSDVTASPDGAP